jgi:hypothetical protein
MTPLKLQLLNQADGVYLRLPPFTSTALQLLLVVGCLTMMLLPRKQRASLKLRCASVTLSHTNMSLYCSLNLIAHTCIASRRCECVQMPCNSNALSSSHLTFNFWACLGRLPPLWWRNFGFFSIRRSFDIMSHFSNNSVYNKRRGADKSLCL